MLVPPFFPKAAPVAAQPSHSNFRDTWRGRAFTSFSLACALALAEPWLNPLTRPAIEMFSAAAQGVMGAEDVPVATVLIDEDEYAQRFGATSPLNRTELVDFFRLFDTPARLPAVIGIDLDLAPANPDDIDSPARHALDAALDALAARVPLVLVWPAQDAACRRDLRACPACRWVAQREKHGIRFASPFVDDRGATFHRADATLGVEMAEATRAASAGAPPDARTGFAAWLMTWFMKPVPPLHREAPCAAASPEALHTHTHTATAPDAHFPAELLLRLGPLLGFKLGDVAQVEIRDALGGALVVVGGAYDSRDTIQPSGWTQTVPSARVHAWVAASAARPYRRLVEAAKLAIEVGLGVLASTVFHAIWVRVGRAGVHFARLAFWCVLFGCFVAAPPLALLAYAIELHDWGLDAASLSVVLIGVEIESVVSSQEMLIHQAQVQAAARDRPSAVDRLVESVWAIVQWLVIGAALVHHRAEWPALPLALIVLLAAGCYFWPGGPLTWVARPAAWRRLKH